jgi:hypothetical protein
MSLVALSEDIVKLFAINEHPSLDSAVNMLREGMSDLGGDHPDMMKASVSLAKLFLIPNTPYTNCENALSLLWNIMQNPPGSTYRCVVDMVSVLRSVEINVAPERIAVDCTRKQCLNVYQALINILPRLASLDMALTRRINVLSPVRDLATTASSHAIALKQFGRAIELLESGRAVFWFQHLRLRTSFESLDYDITSVAQSSNGHGCRTD